MSNADRETSPFPLPLELREVPGEGSTGNPLYRLAADFKWRGITIPEGFKTDLVSAPGWSGVSVTKYRRAAVVHDYLCNNVRKKGLGAKAMARADSALYHAMIDCGAPKAVAAAYYAYVRARHIIIGEG